LLERIKRVDRLQLLIKASSRASLHEMHERLQAHTEEKKIGTTWVIIDVDPVSL
jgi:primosomal protein N'